jgi:hypothetical protein
MSTAAGEQDADLSKAVAVLRSRGIRLVAFDMDQTAVAAHSRGRLRRDHQEDFFAQATPAFLRLVPALFAQGFFLAMATHSDEAEYAASSGVVQPQTHIMGHELATSLVQSCFTSHVAQAIFVVAYNPRIRKTASDPYLMIKRHHMRELQRQFGVQAHEILFFDDTDKVVKDCVEHCGVLTVKVEPKRGFQLSDLLQLEVQA